MLDGSRRALDGQVTSGLEPNVTYLHYPVSLRDRLLEGLARIETPFAMLCSDDEFMVPTTVLKCMGFLKEHPTYNVCCGRLIAFAWNGRGLDLYPKKVGHASHQVDQPTAIDRLRYHLGQYQVTTIYGVHRSDSLRFCLGNALSRPWTNAYAAEMMAEILAAAKAKSAVLSSPSWIRSDENQPVDSPDVGRAVSIDEWFATPGGQIRHEFVEVAAQAIAKLGVVAEDEARRCLASLIEGRVARWQDAAGRRPARWGRARLRVRQTAAFRVARTLYRSMSGRQTDNTPDYFESAGKFKLRAFALEHGVSFDDDIVNDLRWIFTMVVEFHQRSQPTGPSGVVL